MSSPSDIRRWFLKQPHKNQDSVKVDAGASTTTTQDPASNTKRFSKTSKYFSGGDASSSPAGQQTKVAVDDHLPKPQPADKSPAAPTRKQQKTVEPKSEPAAEKSPAPKRKQQIADVKVAESKSEPSPKKVRIQEPDEDDFSNSDASPGRGRGRGRGGGRGRGRGVSSSPAEEAKPTPPAAGRGGRGRGGGGYFQPRTDPPHKGEKEVPEGAEDCLAGLTFVISGTLDSLEREEAEDLIKRHGGRVTSSTSKKTSYLLADEDIGGRKSQKAKELGVPFLTEDGLFDKIRSSKKHQKSIKKVEETKTSGVADVKVDKHQTVKPSAAESSYGKSARVEGDGKAKSAASDSIVAKPRQGVPETEAWPQKYQPRDASDIIGNQSIVKQLHDWLQHWNDQHGGQQKAKKGGGGSSSSSAGKKAALLSGPPGIGKTTSARLISKKLGFEAFEVNASDSRGKADAKVGKGVGGSTANAIKEMVSNESLAIGAIGITHKNANGKKAVLIMDEVDGMSGGDRGGVADLIASIKISKIPIICICNDRYSQKLKSLVNYCLPLNFRRPTKQQMAKRLQQVAQAEGMQVDEVALEELGERVNGDMRMALNELQYMSLRTRVVKFTDMKARLVSSAKDEDISPFNAVDKLMGFDGGRLRMDERLDASMSDLDLVPLLVQENYINYCPTLAGRDENGTARMDLIARAASSIADGDIVNVQIRQYRQWQHSQMGAFMSTIVPAALMHGRRETFVQGERNFNRFGGWLGKNSSFGKKMRLLDDVHVHMLASRVCEPTRQAVRREYLHVLALHLTFPLKSLPKEKAVQSVVGFMEEYSLTQEDFDSILDLSKFEGQHSLMEGVQPAVKSALTKAYKQWEKDHRVKSADLLPVFTPSGPKKITKKRTALELMPVETSYGEGEEDLLEEGLDGSEDEEESGDKLAALRDANTDIRLSLDKGSSQAGGAKQRGKGMQARQTKALKEPVVKEKDSNSKTGKRKREV